MSDPSDAITRQGTEADGTIPVDPEQPVRYKYCAVCSGPMAPDSRVCSRCGYDERLGVTSSAYFERVRKDRDGPARACAKCGYELKGIRSGVCPECGKPFLSRVLPPGASRAAAEQDSDIARRRAYLGALALFLVGILGAFAYYALVGGVELLAGYAALFALRTPILFGVYFLCQALWVGSDQPPGVTAARLLGVVALIDLTGALAGAALVGVVSLMVTKMFMLHRIVQALVAVVLLRRVMEVDLEDAGILALLLIVVHTADTYMLLRILPQSGLV